MRMMEQLAGSRRSCGNVMAAMHLRVERMPSSGLAKRKFCSARTGEFAAAASSENGSQNRCYKDMRQGIAGCRRHVAPALSLC